MPAAIAAQPSALAEPHQHRKVGLLPGVVFRYVMPAHAGMVVRFASDGNPLGLVANPAVGAQDVGWWVPCHPRGEAVSTDPGDHAGTMLISVAAFLFCLLFL